MSGLGTVMKHCKNIGAVGAVLFLFLFMCSEDMMFGNKEVKMEPAVIYSGMKLVIPWLDRIDERFLTEVHKEMNYNWLCEGYVHMDSLTPERQEYPRKTEEEAFGSLEEGTVEDWLSTLSEPRLLTEEEKEAYRKKDSEAILYSYEMERGQPDDIWYSLAGSDGKKWLVIENHESGNGQEFYCFTINLMTEETDLCEKIHGAGGRLYQTVEDEMLIWIMIKEMDGEVVGIAGDYRGALYIGGNFYYEKQKDGTVKAAYQDYHSIGSGTIRAKEAVWDYPY